MEIMAGANNAETPGFAKDLNYQLYQVEDSLDLEMPYVLHLLFPELPDPDLLEYNGNTFKHEHSKIILLG